MHRNHFARGPRLGAIILSAATILLAAASTHASSIAINPVTLSVNGKNVNIGDIAANLNGNTMDTTFTLDFEDTYLLHCVEFQWLQVVTGAVASPTNPQYNGNPLVFPVIDTPNGGYDGQPGEDSLPWYLTAADIAGGNFNGTNPNGSIYYKSNDTPSVVGATFDTWLVAYDGNNQEFCVLAGFEWGSGTLGGAATLQKKNGTGLPTAANITTIATALTNGGFNGWTPDMNCDIQCVPEPSSLYLAVMASVVGLVAWRRRRQK